MMNTDRYSRAIIIITSVYTHSIIIYIVYLIMILCIII